jgi:nucleoside diphosphate kinase
MERNNPQGCENYLKTKLGLLLIKPDAVQLGIVEEIIDFVTHEAHFSKTAQLNGVYIINLQKPDIPLIYASVQTGVGEILKEYMTENICVLVTFKGNKRVDLWKFLHDIRGKRLMDRTPEELQQGISKINGIRDWIPLPSTRKSYENAFQKLEKRFIAGDKSKDIPFTDEEYRIYCRNLVHVPDNLQEVFALLQLLERREIEENLTIEEFKTIKFLLIRETKNEKITENTNNPF